MVKSQERLQTLATRLKERFQDRGCKIYQDFGELTLDVPHDQLLVVANELRDDEDFLFQELIDICGVDYAGYASNEWETTSASLTGFGRGVEQGGEVSYSGNNRFASVYHLLSISLNHRLRLRVYLDSEQPRVDSVTGIWPVADWYEREAFDLFGILYDGHQDLRRILTDYGFIGHPFRKDFPLIGHVEVHYDAEKQRVVYEPVTIQDRTLVPRVIREDNRYRGEGEDQQENGNA